MIIKIRHPKNGVVEPPNVLQYCEGSTCRVIALSQRSSVTIDLVPPNYMCKSSPHKFLYKHACIKSREYRLQHFLKDFTCRVQH